ncbi:peroxidase-related enzyme [Aureimonas frigidaquae]|uniref:Peroxidase-like protein n=1 Tax=Aureimonas frigidaquae TaxID=424757 RepID=A0A0P0Z3X8_9HYPH|nr:peroxidase-related enzyme [Aureimonas frigidaquae]BAT28618.1 peroxidase-like protein [Aureimonas frigidaquae]
MAQALKDFTLDPVGWQPYVEPVRLDEASEAQRDALKVTPSNRKISDYVLVLAHDAEMLRERTPLFNDIMYAKGGLSRGERELGSLSASVMNHCIYCAYVHATRYIAETDQREVVEALYADKDAARLPEREQAIVDYSIKLTRAPHSLDRSDTERLHAVGLSDLEILDLIHAVAIFGWANRLMHTLGEAIEG